MSTPTIDAFFQELTKLRADCGNLRRMYIDIGRAANAYLLDPSEENKERLRLAVGPAECWDESPVVIRASRYTTEDLKR